MKVYLNPYNAPTTYTPALLASGTADSNGTALLTPDMATVNAMLANTGADTTQYNAMSIAVDPDHNWQSTQFMVLDTAAPMNIDAVADLDLSAQPDLKAETTNQITTASPVYSGADCASCLPDRYPYIKVVNFNSSPGMRTDATFDSFATDTHETSAQVGYAWLGGSWYWNGTHIEVAARGSGAGPAERVGVYHYIWIAKYSDREYTTCPHEGGCAHWWDLYQWQGSFQHGGEIVQPARSSQWSTVLNIHKWRYAGQSHQFTDGISLNLPTVTLTGYSTAEYATHTRMDWYPVSGCSGTKYLYGVGAAFNNAPVAYTSCS